ncbi:MAG: cell division protein FtsZ [Bacteroidetes bacterium]|nr:cell division protein FtsZ [Bacteroidota bacterium]
MIEFEPTKSQSSIIKVIGVGGGGSNAVNHMYKQGIKGVDFIVCNTDEQALDISPVPEKVQIGASLTEGRGAGSIPAVGKNAAIENIDQLKSLLEKNTKMLFITAGMGGGTGTGAAPVIAATAKEMGILTVAIVTIPFSFEGRKRRLQAEEGIRELRKNVDTLLVICNDKLRELHGDLSLSKAFGEADNILTNAARGIAEIITVPGYINVDFEDVKTVMKNSGVAIMGSGFAEGENRALKAVELALSSPLLNDNQIIGASNILLYIASGKDEITMDEVSEITEYIQNASGSTAEIIWGNGIDESLGSMIGVTLVATGFNSAESYDYPATAKPKEKNVTSLEAENKPEIKESFIPDISDDINNFTLINKTLIPQDVVIEDTKKWAQSDNESRIYDLEPFLKSDKTPVEQPNNYLNEPVIVFRTEDNKIVENSTEKETAISETNSKILERTNERKNRLRELSMKIKTPQGVAEYEKEPAFVRKNITLTNVIPSSESNISRFSLNEDDDKKVELKQNNSFLHDNVD